MIRSRMRSVATAAVVAVASVGPLTWSAVDPPPAQLVLGDAADPMAGATAYTAILPVLEADPDRWGGAYAEGDRLVVTSVGRPLTEAATDLRAVDVTDGVRLVEGRYSLTDLRDQMDRVTAVLQTYPSGTWATVGPNYATSTVRVELLRRTDELEDELRRAAAADGPPLRISVTRSAPTPA